MQNYFQLNQFDFDSCKSSFVEAQHTVDAKTYITLQNERNHKFCHNMHKRCYSKIQVFRNILRDTQLTYIQWIFEILMQTRQRKVIVK